MLLARSLMHRCIPYCKPEQGEHTALVYSSEDENEATIRRTLWRYHQIHVIRLAEEPDAPIELDTSGIKPFPKTWLVIWQSETADKLG